FDRAIETGAEQRVDDDVGNGRGAAVVAERHRADARRAAVVPSALRVAAQPLRRHGGHDANVEARGPREPRDDVAVAGVVAGAAEYGDAPRGGPALAQHAERRGAGAA